MRINKHPPAMNPARAQAMPSRDEFSPVWAVIRLNYYAWIP